MAYRITLTFVVDITEDEAWGIADGLETAAIARSFREVNGFVSTIGDGREAITGTELEPAAETEAVTLERGTGVAASFGGADGGMITLGGEHGESE